MYILSADAFEDAYCIIPLPLLFEQNVNECDAKQMIEWNIVFIRNSFYEQREEKLHERFLSCFFLLHS